MRWLELLALADGAPAAQRTVFDTALAVFHETGDSRVHGRGAFSLRTLRSLCQALDECGIRVSDDVAQDLGIMSLGVECAWLADRPARAGVA